MIQAATGLILRVYPLTESSLILHWLTPAFGRMATVAKGARRPQSPFRGKLDLFYLADFSFARSRRSELHTLREVTLRDTHTPLRRELGYLQQAAYCAALIETATETETPLPEIFDLLKGLLDSLPQTPPKPQTILAFEVKLLGILGLEPKLTETRLSQSGKSKVVFLREADWPSICAHRLAQPCVAELRAFLVGFLTYHLGRVPKGRDAALRAVELDALGQQPGQPKP